MEIIGKLIKVLPEQSGQSERGTWVRGGFVIETEEQFPRQVAFSLWGEEKVNAVKNLNPHTQIKVHFNPESREYQDKWYTDLRCFKIETFNPLVGGNEFVQSSNSPYPVNNATPFQPNNIAPAPSVPEYEGGNFTQQATEDDDLPF
ncbi:MAG: DUF3127 domain-containing protein [Bacteroidales bacterium]|jgi:hypothetical protein|nr:DUF3127 domain-containing protein [Bacteroidales bacterium]